MGTPMVWFFTHCRGWRFWDQWENPMTGIMRVWCPTECDFLVHLLPENWNSELKKMQTQWCEQALHVHEVFRYMVSTPLTRFSRDCLCLSHKLQARGNHHCHLTEKQFLNPEKPRAKCVEFRLCMSGWTFPSQLIAVSKMQARTFFHRNTQQATW